MCVLAPTGRHACVHMVSSPALCDVHLGPRFAVFQTAGACRQSWTHQEHTNATRPRLILHIFHFRTSKQGGQSSSHILLSIRLQPKFLLKTHFSHDPMGAVTATVFMSIWWEQHCPTTTSDREPPCRASPSSQPPRPSRPLLFPPLPFTSTFLHSLTLLPERRLELNM